MPAVNRPNSTEPPKKRRRESPPATNDPSQLDQPSATMTATPPMSAVAARRAAAAAALAASASSSVASTPTATVATSPPRNSQPQPAEEGNLELGSSSEGEESTSDAEAAPATRAGKRKGKEIAKGKKKEQKPSRYFSGGNDEPSMDVDGENGGEYAGNGSAGLSNVHPPRPPRTRRRRERQAFVDSECYSNIRLEESVNTWKTNVEREDGASCQGVVYALKPHEDLVIHGTFDLTLLAGSISLLGSTVSATSTNSSSIRLPKLSPTTSHRVYSPASHPIPPISAITSNLDSPRPSSLSLYLDAQVDISAFAAVVLVTEAQTGIEGIEGPLKSGGLGCASGMFPTLSRASTIAAGKTWKLITEPVPGLTMLRHVEPWTNALSTLAPSQHDLIDSQPVADPGRLAVMVEGSKRVGKSTFARMLLNKLLDRFEAVAYLDTDLGQPEFTTPGFVSLNVLRRPAFGPAFTHLTLPVSAHYLGSPSPASDPTTYIEAISSLLSTYALEVEYPLIDEPAPSHSRRRHHRDHSTPSIATSTTGKIRERVPLVINTQGWVKGLGADLLAKLKTAAQPTHVCSFISIDDSEGGGGGGGIEGGAGAAFAQQQIDAEQGLSYHLYTLPAAPPNPLESKWTASDYRILSFVSYFHARFDQAHIPSSIATPLSTLANSWDFTSPLVAQPPFAVDWKASSEQISSVHLLDGDDIAYEHILHALNGSLVAIVAGVDNRETSTHLSSFPYDPTAPNPSPSTSRALGLALIRSISPSTTSLHLVTPIPAPSSSSSSSSTAVSLVKGSLELPLALLLDHTATESTREQGIKGTAWREVPFLSIEEGEGAGRRRVRRNLMRRGHN